MAQAKKIDGKSIMLFLDDGSIALTTDTSISLKADTFDSSTKDDGLDGSMDISKCTWTASNDSYYSGNESVSTQVLGDQLMEKFWAKTPIPVIIGTPAKAEGAIPEPGWTPPTTGWKGTAIITAFDLKATVGQKATCTLNLEGIGPLVKLSPGK